MLVVVADPVACLMVNRVISIDYSQVILVAKLSAILYFEYHLVVVDLDIDEMDLNLNLIHYYHQILHMVDPMVYQQEIQFPMNYYDKDVDLIVVIL
ncbi:hypothetical protein DERP_011625 [Dermatophagoides pteronyssinus]|uniref:Uncharacterized protein n=1 Tax=Dermatophagoides pteronyssinus TaxID=6956 RepID=A0ABQ8JXG3_DERPT|nr:hypothetical protein DERP_011625 [Dermatophagoides pteronyssinus]